MTTAFTWFRFSDEQPNSGSRVLVLNTDGTIDTADYYQEHDSGIFYGVNHNGLLFPYNDLYWTYLPDILSSEPHTENYILEELQ